MANTYTQINIHAVFAVKGRHNLIRKDIRPKLFSYISGILKNIKVYPLAINGWKDHVHVFFELNPDMALSEIMKIAKANSSKWFNEQGIYKGRFEWQRGYSAFSSSRTQRNNVIKYINNQENHHSVSEISFRKEYMDMLKKYQVIYEEKYLFEFYDDESDEVEM